MDTRRDRRVRQRRVRRIGASIAAAGALGMTLGIAGPAFAAGGNGASYCSVYGQGYNSGHYTQANGQQTVAELCNPNGHSAP
jgi:hypothetical protein